jgi:hypothetical protein
MSFLENFMNTTQYFLSLSQELRGLQNRVRNFIEDAHWQTDGEWKESVLRSFLRRNLPKTVEIGRGFMVSSRGCSSQIDVLIYDAAKPVLFHDGDLVFITPDALCGMIEVKSSLNKALLAEAVKKVAKNIPLITTGRAHRLVAIFAYESSVATDDALEILCSTAGGNADQVIDLVCLGDSHIIHWWYDKSGKILKKWFSYKPQKIASGYFLHDIIQFINPQSVEENAAIWFPPDGRESDKDGEKDL